MYTYMKAQQLDYVTLQQCLTTAIKPQHALSVLHMTKGTREYITKLYRYAYNDH